MTMENFTNGTNETDCPIAITPEDKKVAVPVILLLICFIGIVGNLGVIYVVYKFRQMNPLFLNLAVADLLFNLFGLPIYAAFYATKHRILIGDVTCKTLYYLTYVTMGVSIYSLVAICLLRYLSIKYPLHLRTMLGRGTSYKAAAVTWVVMLLLNIPLLIIMTEEGGKPCSLRVGESSLYYIYVTVVFGIDFITPATIIAVLSTFIVIHVFHIQKEHRTLSENEKGGFHKASKMATKRLMILVILVFSLFIVCWAPMHVLFLRAVLNRDVADDRPCIWKQVTEYIFLIAQILAFSNSSVNPILYNFVSKEFRLAFARAMCPCYYKKRDEEQSEITRRITVSYRTDAEMEVSDSCYQSVPLKTLK
ncbi:somatostatin receptor type 5 [Lingula anatina]|uniref:Somatostatin receptor type 5 n=1 Tax=Lingula anatina TaxID=7574 RepID=A0A1S3HES4_LINAN|nr:somatostatin receptor type 5 [Lingula anatina]XP_013384009.1 somatostatin receptor type 5 [Lingula anatina]XP_013384011.1 somatostatin receptor type 5 [Lingula anatina]XP_013384012.1 somatostatin receptor type 5 [Lingula anatina]XP_013384013.1 somatostatin receptor type 5 [Lingula anatina]XP_013384014.1 somatostatin receptor type 5 [Lingula anatina]|eukprot:XP_013384008.1 somatostatin receptor type 5 [Lingula anatina]